MKFETRTMNQINLAHLLTDVVAPRPIAWVSTVSAQGIYNLAPFSAYGMVGSRPFVVTLSIGTTREGRRKDTILNIEETGEFVINEVTEELAEAMNQTCAPYPRDVSEFEKTGLTPVTGDMVKAPLLKESPINMECRVLHIMRFGEGPSLNTLVIGEVVVVHVADKNYDAKTGRLTGLKIVGRMGGDGDIYTRTRDTFQMKRPIL
jgi:flavin reductase (DIM6/NTAB) family NADH-FMN oxidoreductase RutF